MGNMVLPYYLFGIYTIELGKFFKNRFKNFSIAKDAQGVDIPLKAQVFFGTPRAAFRHYFEKFNGMIKLPMINYHMGTIERAPEFEPLVNTYAVDRDTQIAYGMRAPQVYTLTYAINFFNNSYQERDFMLHKLFTAFPKGEAHLIYFPDPTNKTTYLQMPHILDPSTQDITELEGLDPKETRDIIKTSVTMKCTRAFVPYDFFETPVVNTVGFGNTVEYIQIDGKINDIVNNSQLTVEYVKWLKAPQTRINVGVTIPQATVNII